MVLNIAHRGASGLAPENTLAAFKEALKYNIDMVELDIRITKDKRIVVMHDATTKRTGIKKRKIKKTKLKDLQTIDVGRRFNKKFDGEKIPLLFEVIQLVKNKALLNIELKGSFKNHEEKLLKLISREGVHESTILSTKNRKLLTRLRVLDEKIKLSYIVSKPQRRYIIFGKKLNLYSFQVQKKLITKRFVRNCKRNKFKVFVWTVNSMKSMRKFTRAGVDGIITNYPNRLNEFIDALES